MAYFLTESAPGACDLTAKNRVWGFFAESNKTRLENRRQAPELRRKNRPTPTKTASGIPLWPSRDPIEERGGINLYAFVGNDGVQRIDVLGRNILLNAQEQNGRYFILVGENNDTKITEVVDNGGNEAEPVPRRTDTSQDEKTTGEFFPIDLVDTGLPFPIMTPVREVTTPARTDSSGTTITVKGKEKGCPFTATIEFWGFGYHVTEIKYCKSQPIVSLDTNMHSATNRSALSLTANQLEQAEQEYLDIYERQATSNTQQDCGNHE